MINSYIKAFLVMIVLVLPKNSVAFEADNFLHENPYVCMTFGAIVGGAVMYSFSSWTINALKKRNRDNLFHLKTIQKEENIYKKEKNIYIRNFIDEVKEINERAHQARLQNQMLIDEVKEINERAHQARLQNQMLIDKAKEIKERAHQARLQNQMLIDKAKEIKERAHQARLQNQRLIEREDIIIKLNNRILKMHANHEKEIELLNKKYTQEQITLIEKLEEVNEITFFQQNLIQNAIPFIKEQQKNVRSLERKLKRAQLKNAHWVYNMNNEL